MKLRRTDRSPQKAILQHTIETLRKMLVFATSVKIQRYITDKHTVDYRQFEAMVAANDEQQRINGTGVLALRCDISRPSSSDEQDFFRDEVPLGSYELGAHIDEFPLSAAAASYLFTLLEIYGNEVAAIINPGSINTNKAWHEDLRGFADLRDKVQVEKAREAFAKHFDRSSGDVPELAVHRMVELKRSRNDFAHDGIQRVDFSQFLHDTLAVVCHIAFLTTDEARLSVYPWDDHSNIFSPTSKI